MTGIHFSKEVAENPVLRQIENAHGHTIVVLANLAFSVSRSCDETSNGLWGACDLYSSDDQRSSRVSDARANSACQRAVAFV